MTVLVTPQLRPAQTWGGLGQFHAILRDRKAMRYRSTPPHPDLGRTRDWHCLTPNRHPVTHFGFEIDGAMIGKAGAWVDGVYLRLDRTTAAS